MTTKGITYARTRKVLFLLAFVAATPVMAQVNYTSPVSISFAGKDNRFSASLVNNYSFTGTVSRQPTIDQKTFYLSIPDNDEIIALEEDDHGRPDEKKKFFLNENRGRPIGENIQISFRPTSFVYPKGSRSEIGVPEYSKAKLLLYATVLKQYAKKNGYDTTYAFLSNMGMLCSKKRFFVVNLVTMEIEQSGLVSQGRGQGRTKYDKQYSNIVDSKCTSLGRYRIMNKYKGSYGESYRITGLDTSNHNAYKRNIVLHSMGCIPDVENLAPACISEGCPAVSVNFLSSLSKIIDTRKKPVLLWVFDSNLEEVMAEEIKSETKYHTCSIHHYDNPDVQ